MTVSGTTASAGPFEGNDSITALPFSFKITDEDQIVVKVVTDADGSIETLTLSSDYTVAFDTDAETGTVTLTSALATGKTATVLRVTDYTQLVDLINQGSFFPETHEGVFDKIVMMIQEIAEDTTRAALGSNSADELLNLLLGVDGSGSGLDADLLDGLDSTDFSRAIHIVSTASNRTFQLSDKDGFIIYTGSSAGTFTIPPNSSVAFPVNTVIAFTQDGAGTLSIAAGSGVTLRIPPSEGSSLIEQYSMGAVIQTATDVWRAVGALE